MSEILGSFGEHLLPKLMDILLRIRILLHYYRCYIPKTLLTHSRVRMYVCVRICISVSLYVGESTIKCVICIAVLTEEGHTSEPFCSGSVI